MSAFTPIEIPNPVIEIPEDVRRRFCNMGSLRTFITSRMIQEASMVIMSQVDKQLKGVDYYD